MYTPDFYSALMRRHSVRRFQPNPLSVEQQEKIQTFIAQIQPLFPENKMHWVWRDTNPDENLATVIGGYGRLLTPPHYLALAVSGPHLPLVDCGFRMEQLAVFLTKMQLDSCYVGCIANEIQIKNRFNFPANARIYAVLAMGEAATNPVGRLFNRGMRSLAGATRKLALDKIYFENSFENPVLPPDNLLPLITAVQAAPSALNAQPWRLLKKDNFLYFCVTRRNSRYRGVAYQKYRYYDGGISMANLSIAMQAFNRSEGWEFDAEFPKNVFPETIGVELLARIRLN